MSANLRVCNIGGQHRMGVTQPSLDIGLCTLVIFKAGRSSSEVKMVMLGDRFGTLAGRQKLVILSGARVQVLLLQKDVCRIGTLLKMTLALTVMEGRRLLFMLFFAALLSSLYGINPLFYNILSRDRKRLSWKCTLG